MKKKAQKKQDLHPSTVLIAVLGFCSVIAVLYLISISPRNLTKKAPVFQKTHNISSKEKCIGPATVQASEKLRIPILLYHYVEHVKDHNDFMRQRLNIHPEIFETQLKTLVESQYQTVFMKDIPEMLETSRICGKSVALTFDDGYEDFYINVFPILKKYKAKATVYIIYNFIGKPNFLNEWQIEELIKSGLVEVGSHTLDHLDLSVTNRVEARNQIIRSKELLEKKFNISVKSFAYPYGKYVPIDIDFVKEASYSSAVTVAEGTMHSKGSEFILTRERPGKYIGYDIGKGLEMSLK